MTALGVVALTVTVPLPTGAHMASSHETSSTTVAVPAVRTTCTRKPGTARAKMASGVGPGAVNGLGVKVDPSQVRLAPLAVPSVAASTSAAANLTLPARSLPSV